jgi:hypothetical protein
MVDFDLDEPAFAAEARPSAVFDTTTLPVRCAGYSPAVPWSR